jgi:hypothetical protein
LFSVVGHEVEDEKGLTAEAVRPNGVGRGTHSPTDVSAARSPLMVSFIKSKLPPKGWKTFYRVVRLFYASAVIFVSIGHVREAIRAALDAKLAASEIVAMQDLSAHLGEAGAIGDMFAGAFAISGIAFKAFAHYYCLNPGWALVGLLALIEVVRLTRCGIRWLKRWRALRKDKITR